MSVIIDFIILLFAIGLQVTVLVYIYKSNENFTVGNNADLKLARKYLREAKRWAIGDIVLLCLLGVLIFFVEGALKIIMMVGIGFTCLTLLTTGVLSALAADKIKKSNTNSHSAWVDAVISSSLVFGTVLLLIILLVSVLIAKKIQKNRKEEADGRKIALEKLLGVDSKINVN